MSFSFPYFLSGIPSLIVARRCVLGSTQQLDDVKIIFYCCCSRWGRVRMFGEEGRDRRYKGGWLQAEQHRKLVVHVCSWCMYSESVSTAVDHPSLDHPSLDHPSLEGLRVSAGTPRSTPPQAGRWQTGVCRLQFAMPRIWMLSGVKDMI